MRIWWQGILPQRIVLWQGIGLELTVNEDFMYGIIHTAMDVRLLRKEKIIEGDLDYKEIVILFNGIGRSLEKMSVKSEFRKSVAELNKVYESMPVVWAKRIAKKQVWAWLAFQVHWYWFRKCIQRFMVRIHPIWCWFIFFLSILSHFFLYSLAIFNSIHPWVIEVLLPLRFIYGLITI